MEPNLRILEGLHERWSARPPILSTAHVNLITRASTAATSLRLAGAASGAGTEFPVGRRTRTTDLET